MSDNKAVRELTVGVITHSRSTLFANLLTHLKVCIAHTHSTSALPVSCSLLVVNNSGKESHAAVSHLVDESGIAETCPVTIHDSPENNISVGRNLVLSHCQTPWLIFVDDDEYPVPEWINKLVEQQEKSGSAVVAGPILPVYPDGTTGWVSEVDLHNKGVLRTGDKVRRVATGNCLLDLQQIGEQRFDPMFGLSGGSDALFFDQMSDRGLSVVWQEEAIVYETIPAKRTSPRYMIFRCMTQGYNFKRVVLRDAGFVQHAVFLAKAIAVGPVSVALGAIAIPFSDRTAAHWLKRGFTNLGKLVRPSKRLYG